jgi:hypothetical protein
MPRQPAPCGTMSAYRRHKRKGEPVDAACHQAMLDVSRARSGRADDDAQSAPVVPLHEGFVASTGADVDARERLIANMQLVERAMEALVEADPMKIVQLSTRHSELVAQLVAVSGGGSGGKGADPFDRFFDARSAAGGTTPPPRK